jgi:tetratricopeptide (TPR) repeat protein
MVIKLWTSREISALREARRMTVEEFADALCASVRAVKDWEGPQAAVPRPDKQRLLDDMLRRICDTEPDVAARFALFLGEQEQPMPKTAECLESADTLPATMIGQDDAVALSRRNFVMGVGAGLGGAALGSTVPLSMAEGLHLVSGQYRAAYRTAPARELLASADSHLRLVMSLQPRDQPDKVRTSLLGTAGEMAALAGTILGLDLGQWRDAGTYYDLASIMAAEVADPELESVVMACQAFQAAYSDNPDLILARDLAEAAVRKASRGACTITQGWTAAVASERTADMGDTSVSLRYLETAYVALDATPDDRWWSGLGSFEPAKLTAYEGGNYRRMGKPDKAIGVLDVALSVLDDGARRHRATALIDRAEAQRDAGRVDAACEDTKQALTLVAHTQHAGTLARAETIARAARGTRTREAADLWEHLLKVKASAKTTPRNRAIEA